MTAALPPVKKDRIKTQGRLLLKGEVTLLDLSSFIGLAVASDPAIELAPLRYKYLEIFRNRELARYHGNYNSKIILDDHAWELIQWWIESVDYQVKSLRSSSPQLVMFSDASLTGWGAVMGDVKTGGHWAYRELDHINCLELKAILLGLKSLCKDIRGTHIRLRSDNSTTVACIERCGSSKPYLNSLIEQIFAWAESRGITLSAQYVKGLRNVEADRVQSYEFGW